MVACLDGLASLRPEREAGPPALAELAEVELTASVQVEAGRVLPSASIGTIVGVWAGGEAYEVEFAEPFAALVTVEAAKLREPGRIDT